MENVRILKVEIYHPDNEVFNSFYLKHFKSQGKDIEGLLRAFGRDKRYIIDDDNENTVTMGIKVANKVLKSAGLEGKDIDMVMFSSQFPEYTFPSQSLIVHNAINGKEDCMCMDTNTNCAGMLVTVEQTIRAMMGNPHVKRALVIGSDYTSIHCRDDDELTYPNFADGAAAIILEKTEEGGFIDSMCKSNGATWESVKYPACGMSKVYKEELSVRDRRLQWTPFEGLFIIDKAVTSIHALLNRNSLKIEEINSYCFSQYSKAFSNLGSEKLGVDINKFIYIGDAYGYTGTSSPFISFYEGVKTGRIKRGDIVCLWTVAINWTICTMLIRY
ncbi:3-oxoacyl-[acyl-carrier-protein] synthase III C-terminal domain-containing protein [Clostridium estertheticum]|uniref:3-oxoacyl-[acyl-carrier-protein] synthase III C-terminal domain-containing protein n=1 Tax=Clostridium estertheticum TaxID=238834 RepID=UPI001C0BC092|nr:3-oxoacyl-[acyl-carrier-protein] synthase III C-terminal domain-containing protein [Clostridium estertheticum]MBU3075248.1 ketoacyl-ACP synthase III [Clostridium estertheticum]MBU3165463.1 ketoacyl-ACP synthase III [Clostridium estertheticum]